MSLRSLPKAAQLLSLASKRFWYFLTNILEHRHAEITCSFQFLLHHVNEAGHRRLLAQFKKENLQALVDFNDEEPKWMGRGVWVSMDGAHHIDVYLDFVSQQVKLLAQHRIDLGHFLTSAEAYSLGNASF